MWYEIVSGTGITTKQAYVTAQTRFRQEISAIDTSMHRDDVTFRRFSCSPERLIFYRLFEKFPSLPLCLLLMTGQSTKMNGDVPCRKLSGYSPMSACWNEIPLDRSTARRIRVGRGRQEGESWSYGGGSRGGEYSCRLFSDFIGDTPLFRHERLQHHRQQYEHHAADDIIPQVGDFREHEAGDHQ